MVNPQYKPQNNSCKLSEPQFYGPQFLRFQIFQTKFWIFKILNYHIFFIQLIHFIKHLPVGTNSGSVVFVVPGREHEGSALFINFYSWLESFS